MVRALLDDGVDAALGNGKGDGHASHDGKLSLSRHRPESIGRHPRKVSKSHRTGSIPNYRQNVDDAHLGSPRRWNLQAVGHPNLGLKIESHVRQAGERGLVVQPSGKGRTGQGPST